MTTRCGGCGALVPEGAAMQAITVSTVKRRFVRCEACVGSAGPPEIGRQGMTSGQLTKRMDAIGQVAAQFQRPERKPVAVVRKRAYRGEHTTTQPELLRHLPWYDK